MVNRYYIAFHEAFDQLHINYRKNKKYLQDKRLSSVEKKLLNAHLLIRNNKSTEVFELLETCNPTNSYFHAHRQLLWGMALINTGRNEEALTFIKEAYEEFHPDYDQKFIYMAYRDSFIAGINLSDKEVCKHYLDKIKELELHDHEHRHIKQIMEFDYSVLIEDIETATKLKASLDGLKEEMVFSDLPGYLINCFHLSMLTQDFKMAKEAMNELKGIKKFHQSENYKFMSSLLGYLENDEPIYLRDEDLKDVENLNYQAQCIKSLSYGNVEEAFGYWQRLSKLNSKEYQNEFDYRGRKNLFSHCLRKALRKMKQERMEIPANLSLFEKLDFIFTQRDGSVISKEELFKHLWQKEVQTKDDFQKLSRLLCKYRKNTEFDIKTHHGSYKIQKKKAA